MARARIGGGLPLDGQLSAAMATVARPSEQLFSSFEDYARDFYRTANDISALSSLSDSQLSGAQSAQSTMEAQLETLQDQKEALKVGFDAQIDSLAGILNTAQLQLDAANGINTSVLSVADAVAALTAGESVVERFDSAAGNAEHILDAELFEIAKYQVSALERTRGQGRLGLVQLVQRMDLGAQGHGSLLLCVTLIWHSPTHEGSTQLSHVLSQYRCLNL